MFYDKNKAKIVKKKIQYILDQKLKNILLLTRLFKNSRATYM